MNTKEFCKFLNTFNIQYIIPSEKSSPEILDAANDFIKSSRKIKYTKIKINNTLTNIVLCKIKHSKKPIIVINNKETKQNMLFHDLRNNLGTIYGLSEITQLENDTNNKNLELIIHSAKEGINLLENYNKN